MTVVQYPTWANIPRPTGNIWRHAGYPWTTRCLTYCENHQIHGISYGNVSGRLSATCRLPGVFMDPKLWPEGALVRWWRAPRVKPPTISHDVIHSDEVSDETMRGMPMPNNSFHSARENVENSQLISDSTMANIQVPSFDSSSTEDSDTETNTHPESLFVRSPIRTRSVSRNRPVQRSRSELDLRND